MSRSIFSNGFVTHSGFINWIVMAAMQQIVMQETSPLKATSVPCSIQNELTEGGVHVQIVKFSLTSNTVTYALLGRAVLKTFEHFPNKYSGRGSSPAWGVGVVTQSKCIGVSVGTRLQGYFPMAPWCTLYPSEVDDMGRFEDTAPHRQKLISAYRSYLILPGLIPGKIDEEDLGISGALLFTTGWSIAQQAAALGATSLLLTSASSRTSVTAAFTAKFHKMFAEVIGITSQQNVEFVRRSGLYDLVVTYKEIASLGSRSDRKLAVYDVAGDDAVSAALRTHLGAQAIGWHLVGKTHVAAVKSTAAVDLNGGAKPANFLVFQAMQDAAKAIGEKMPQVLASAQTAFIKVCVHASLYIYFFISICVGCIYTVSKHSLTKPLSSSHSRSHSRILFDSTSGNCLLSRPSTTTEQRQHCTRGTKPCPMRVRLASRTYAVSGPNHLMQTRTLCLCHA